MSGVLLDTTVLIDVSRGFAPTVAWLSAQPSPALYLSSITVGELVRGAYRRGVASPSRLASELRQIETRLLPQFANRVLAFDRAAAEIWGRLVGEGESRGRRPPLEDAKIAAIALSRSMTVATSNIRDFGSLCTAIDPRTA